MVQCYSHVDWNSIMVPCQGWKNISCEGNTNFPTDSTSHVQASTRFTIMVLGWSSVIFSLKKVGNV
jgi:hypothetical protein